MHRQKRGRRRSVVASHRYVVPTVLFGLLASFGACKKPEMFAYRAEVRLPEAYRTEPLLDIGREVIIREDGSVHETKREGTRIVLTADTRLTWKTVAPIVAKLGKDGPLWVSVGKGKSPQMMRLHDRAQGDFFYAKGKTGGQLCVWPRRGKTSSCRGAGYTKRIERSVIFDMLGRGSKKYDVSSVLVYFEDGVKWGDVVRVVDAARSAPTGSLRVEIQDENHEPIAQ